MSDNDSQRDPQQDSWNQVSWNSDSSNSGNQTSNNQTFGQSNDQATGDQAANNQAAGTQAAQPATDAQATNDAASQPTRPLFAASDAQPTQPIQSVYTSGSSTTQPTQTIPDPTPDYGAAAQRPAESTGYRLAPGYGAYSTGYGQNGNAAYGQNAGYQNSYQSGYQAPQAGNANPGNPSNPTGAGYAPNAAQPGQPGPSPFGGNGANGNGANGNGVNGNDGPQQPQSPAAAQKHGVSPVLTAVIAAIVAVALSLAIGFAAVEHGWIKVGSTTTSTTTLKSSTGSDSGSSTQVADGSDWVTVAKNVNNSVVSILVTTSEGSARGSGAILDTDGHVVTNNHVVSDASKIYVTLSDGSMYESTVVGTDATTDLAVLKMNTVPSGLTPITFADSDSLAVGESVMAIGNPLGLSNTTTTGIISALNRPVSTYDSTSSNSSVVVTNAVQIDAAINPGNSGGPTFNSAGQVIGINSSIATTSTSSSSDSSSSGSIGIGFAIPSNLVKSVCDQIINSGSVEHVQLGVKVSTQYIEYNNGYRAGAQIESVTSGSAAEKAGLQQGDLIVAYNGNLVNSSSSVLGYVRATNKGDTVTLTVIRNGQMQDIQVTMDQVESSTSSSSSSSNGSSNNGNSNGNSGNGDSGGLYDPFGLFGNGDN